MQIDGRRDIDRVISRDSLEQRELKRRAREKTGPLYVAIGASETVGAGSSDPLRQSWPQVLFRAAFTRRATFVNLGVPGATVAEALEQEVPYAEELRPDVVTIWLNVNDLVTGVPPRTTVAPSNGSSPDCRPRARRR